MMEIETISMLIWIIDFSFTVPKFIPWVYGMEHQSFQMDCQFFAWNIFNNLKNWMHTHTHNTWISISISKSVTYFVCDAYAMSVQLLLPYRRLTRCKLNKIHIFKHGHASVHIAQCTHMRGSWKGSEKEKTRNAFK